jgi:hypothetical protein
MADSNGKDVIYVDVDDEITGIIDKVAQAKAKIVALVLPKRAAVFQSVVNMKLLKKRADAAKKNLVLITSEPSLMPLAGSVGLYVAKTLQSKPEVPAALDAAAAGVPEEVDEAVPVGGSSEEFDAAQAADKPVGELAGMPDQPGANQMSEETIELDNTASETPSASGGKDVTAMAADGAAGKVGGKKGKNKKLKVPNFNKFRLKLVLGLLLIALLVLGWFVANNVLPKATVSIKTDTSNVNSSLTPTLDTSAAGVDTSTQTVPAKVEQTQKTYTGQASASGKKNEGNKASGSLTMSIPCSALSGSPPTIPAGTGVSSNGLTFITQDSAQLSNPDFSGGGCVFTGSTNITAQQGGTQYNVNDGSSFTVAGYNNVTGTGSASGGTDNIVTVVQQSDIDGAKKQAEQGSNKDAVKSQLQQTLQGEGEYAITATFTSGTPQTNVSAKVGDQVSNVTVTETVTYTMFGAQKSDLKKLIDNSVNQQIDTGKQTIQDDGLGNASITMPNPGNNSKVQLAMQVTSVIGPHLNQAELKKAIVGKKSGEVRSIIKSNPGVENVSVNFSPFWVDTVPKNTTKITFKFEKASP